MNTVDLNIFFDESGKRSNKPNLMGGLLIPDVLYRSAKFQIWSQQLRDGDIKFHWVGYTGDSRINNNVTDIMTLVAQHHNMIKFNVINYDYSILSAVTNSARVLSQIVYSKFPERLIYGLLRKYGKNMYVDASIYIESATEYRDIELDASIKDQLNVQSAYRGEQFRVIQSELTPKGQEIGLELTDLLLGFVRTIILNNCDQKSKTTRAKNSLVVELLKNSAFYSFMNSIRLYEWTNTRQLDETTFSNYLQVFLSTQHDKYI